MPSTSKARWATRALDSRLAPVPQKRRPNQVPTMQRRSRGRELVEAGDAGRPVLAVDDEEVELLAAVAPRLEAVDVVQRLLDRGVRTPREPARDLGVAGELEQRGRVLADGQAQGQRGTMHRDAGAAVRHPREPTGAGGRARRRPRGGRQALSARRRLRGVRRLARRVGGAPARPPGRHLDPRQRRSLGGDRGARRRARAQRRRELPRDARRRDDRRAGRAARERRPRPRHARLARLAQDRPRLLLARARRRRAGAARGRRPTGGWSSATSTSRSTASAPTRSSSSPLARSACRSTAITAPRGR